MLFSMKTTSTAAVACLLAGAAHGRNIPIRRQAETSIFSNVTSVATVTSCAPGVADCPGATANPAYPTLAPPLAGVSSVVLGSDSASASLPVETRK